MVKKKRNPADATLRNVKASNRINKLTLERLMRVEAIVADHQDYHESETEALALLRDRVIALEDAFKLLDARVQALEPTDTAASDGEPS